MAGHLRERAPGTWELSVYTGRDPLTRRKRYAYRTYRGGQRDAERALAAFVTELDGGGPTAGGTFGDLLERWYATCHADWSPSTAYQTRRLIDGRLQALADRPVKDLSTADLDDFYAALRDRGAATGRPLAPATVTRTHGIIRLALDQAVRWGWRPDNPATLARPGRARKTKINPPEPAQVVELLKAAEAADPDLLTFLVLDAETGARRGELAALRLGDLTTDTVRIERDIIVGETTPENLRRYAGHIWPSGWARGQTRTALIEKEPKTAESVREIALSPATVKILEGHRRRMTERALLFGARLQPDALLFAADPEGRRPLRPDTWTRRYTALREQIGLPHRLHDLRHFVATTLLTAGVDVVTVAGRLGHGGGGKTTVSIYGHFRPAPDRLAAELMAGVLAGGHSDEETPENVVPIRPA